jgi:hypothetical protein
MGISCQLAQMVPKGHIHCSVAVHCAMLHGNGGDDMQLDGSELDSFQPSVCPDEGGCAQKGGCPFFLFKEAS